MAKAAEAQTRTLGGQWMLLTGNMQKLAGAATAGLASGLEHGVLPAANRAVEQITAIFGDKGLTNEQKLARARTVIRRQLGPVWEDIKHDIDEADIPGKLGDAVAAATPKILDAMGEIAPKAAKAFVDGWLHSGPEAQLITALFFGNKLRKSDFGKALFSGGTGGGKGGAVSTLLGTRGATPKNPVWVAVASGKGLGDSVKDIAKKTAVPASVAARVAASVGGGEELAALGVGGGLAALLAYVAVKNAHNDYDYRAGGSTVRRQAAGTIPAPGYGTGPVGALAVTNIVNIDGKTFSRATATTDAVEQGRLAATRAASG
jgi:hypothetical protein